MAFCIEGFQNDRGVVNRLEKLQEPCDRWVSCLVALALVQSSLAQGQLEFMPQKGSLHVEYWHYVQHPVSSSRS